MSSLERVQRKVLYQTAAADVPMPGWQQGLRAVLTVIAVVAIAVVARRLGSRASTWSANRRRGESAEEDANDRL
jgi:hypothetical protein